MWHEQYGSELRGLMDRHVLFKKHFGSADPEVIQTLMNETQVKCLAWEQEFGVTDPVIAAQEFKSLQSKCKDWEDEFEVTDPQKAKDRVAKLWAASGTLKKSHKDLKAKLVGESKTNDSLKSELETNKAALGGHEKTIQSLQLENGQQIEEVRDLEHRYQALQRKYNDLDQKHQTVEADLASLRAVKTAAPTRTTPQVVIPVSPKLSLKKRPTATLTPATTTPAVHAEAGSPGDDTPKRPDLPTVKSCGFSWDAALADAGEESSDDAASENEDDGPECSVTEDVTQNQPEVVEDDVSEYALSDVDDSKGPDTQNSVDDPVMVTSDEDEE